ncbi:MAG TPA: hypothetical protein VE224_12695 [Pseudolabrys sp.]|jgi:hypothetical protein|nr:hypothetical protein [Pseudolabrys sp.]
MSNAKQNVKKRIGADRKSWIFGGIVAVLALLDLFVWASLWNVPNPISVALLGPQPEQSMPLPRPVFAAPPAGATVGAGIR